MKPLRSIIGLLAVFSGLGAGFLDAAPISTWAEIGDAGQTTATGQVTTGIGPLTTITGAIPDPRGVDLFKIHISGAFTAVTDVTFDPMLFLFDSTGKTLLFNDEFFAWPNGNSFLSGNFGAGDYWLGISYYPNGFTDVSTPTNVNTPGFWDLAADNSAGGRAYTIKLTGASFAGEPMTDAGTTFTLLGLAVSGLAAVRRRLCC